MEVNYKHREIYRTLVAEVANGAYDATQRLPSEAQLVRRFRVSRPTAARALRDLEAEGLVERRVGAGSFLVKGARPAIAEKSRHLGLLLPGVFVSEIFEVLTGELASLARANDYSLLWGTSAHSRPRADLTVKDAEEICQHFIDRQVRGVFFAPFEFAPDKEKVSKRTAEQLKRAGIAVVLLDRDLEPFPLRSDWDLVGIDNVMAGYLAAEHLIKLGVRRIAFVVRPGSAPSTTARVAGAREALLSAGIQLPGKFVYCGEPEDAAFVREITAGHTVDGIICANDFTAGHLMKSLAKAKIRVPEDIRLVGFDNMKYAELLAVSLTTISQPLREIAANAIRVMLDRLADPTLPPAAVLSKPSLVVRASCGAFMRH